MKLSRWKTLNLALFALLLSFAQPVLSEGAFCIAAPAAVPPVLDGRLSDGVWLTSIMATPFVVNDGLRLSVERTAARVAWDPENLYVAFHCSDANLNMGRKGRHHLRTSSKKHDDVNFFLDDVVELFVSRPESSDYYHFAVNPLGQLFEERGRDRGFTCEWVAEAFIGDGFWSVEMRIPFRSLRIHDVHTGMRLAINFGRHNPHWREDSSWGGTVGSFHDSKQFGLVALSAESIGVHEFRMTLRTPSKVYLRVRAENRSSVERRMRVTLLERVERQERKRVGEVKLRPSDIGEVELRLTGCSPVKSSLQIEVNEQVSGTLMLRSPPFPAKAPGAWGIMQVASGGRFQLYLNGRRVGEGGRGEYALDFQEGLNSIALRVSGRDPSSLWSHLRLIIEGQKLDDFRGWRARFGNEPRAKDVEFDDADWLPAQVEIRERAGKMKSLRPVGNSDTLEDTNSTSHGVAWFRRNIVVNTVTPPLWPMKSRVAIPAESAQLIYPQLIVPSSFGPSCADFVLDLPKSLLLEAVEPMQGCGVEKIEERVGQTADDHHRYVLHIPHVQRPGIELVMRFTDAKNKLIRAERAFMFGGTFDWRDFETNIIVPPTAKSVRPLLIKQEGRGVVGTLHLDDLRIEDADMQEVVYEESFTGPLRSDLLDVGVGGVIKHANAALQFSCSTKEVDERSVVNLSSSDLSVGSSKRFRITCVASGERLTMQNTSPRLALLVRDSGVNTPTENAVERRMRFHFESHDGNTVELAREVPVISLPPLNAKPPQHVRFIPCYYRSLFSEPRVHKAIAENMRRAGIRWLYGTNESCTAQIALAEGVRLLLSLPWKPYSIEPSPNFLLDHPGAAAISVSGAEEATFVCPTYILTRGNKFVPALSLFIEDWMNLSKPTEVNFDFEQAIVTPRPRFCFCARCVDAFRSFAKITDTLMPSQIVMTHRAAWVDFRCSQNVQLIKLVRDLVKSVEENTAFSVYSGYASDYTKERYGVDWSLVAPFVSMAFAGYNAKAEHIVATRKALGNTPLIGGEMYLETMSYSEPYPPPASDWANRLLHNVVTGGGQGVIIWWLPVLDGEAWHGTARVVDIVSKWERFFLKGRLREGLVEIDGDVDERQVHVIDLGCERLVLIYNRTTEQQISTIKHKGVSSSWRVRHVGEKLVRDAMKSTKVVSAPYDTIILHVYNNASR